MERPGTEGGSNGRPCWPSSQPVARELESQESKLPLFSIALSGATMVAVGRG
jgi:hypothetical protein